MTRTMATWQPFTLMRDIDRLFDAPRVTLAPTFPRFDVFDREGTLVVRTEVAGVPADTIDVTVEDGTLTVSGTRSFEQSDDGEFHRRELFEGEFKRTVLLPEGLDLDEVRASAKDGILEIRIPRSAEVLPKKVKVELEG